MKRKFFVHITGIVESDEGTASTEGLTDHEEMTEAVKASFKPDLQWGVEVLTYDAHVFQSETP